MNSDLDKQQYIKFTGKFIQKGNKILNCTGEIIEIVGNGVKCTVNVI